MSFLPDNYEAPASSGGNYMKLAQGKNTFRIIGDSTKGTAIFGWIGWTEEDGKRKPVRSKEKPPAGLFKEKPKPFFSFLALNEGAVQCLEITQRGIQDALVELVNDPDWGDPKQYDICIQREGEGMETSYTVLPKPKAPLSEADIATIKEKLPLINMAALYEGEDPFAATKSDDADANADPF